MAKQRIFDVVRNCLATIGFVELCFSLYNLYLLLRANQMDLSTYIHIGAAFLALFVAMFWTMVERERKLKKEAETDFFGVYPEHKDYKYFWEVYSLYHHGKSLSASDISDARFIEWRLEIKNCLKQWGETKNRVFGLNLPPHGTVDDYLKKLEDTLADHCKNITI